MDSSSSSSSVQSFSNLPPTLKIALVLAGIACFLGAIYLVSEELIVVGIVAGGSVFVGLLLLLYRLLLLSFKQRRSAPLERSILENTGVSPHSISEPARRARLDDFRKSFEGGIEKFRAAGKDLYSLPWYMLVGDSGSGKTEAIRHCSVGFPPGLQDHLQGAGGTLNMHWWFTNYAIILDIAGRVMFEEVAAGDTSEWKEFLNLLVRYRPNCPINGMLLVIPAESLIQDRADVIEAKATRIHRRLDGIQRVLGVRFPVFIVITKSDKIFGFREFFESVTDPQLQHQVLGWSNAGPLDQPFNPEVVQTHLETVIEKIRRRRLGLMLDPAHTEDPIHGRRVDEVDALYAFPASLHAIGSALRRYLELIFQAGEWSPKPLFLRGIYFTSSMCEGAALDAQLAEALKVPIEQLPEGRAWERDRAYFLRDLFMNKVFRERGLVTRASDTRKLQRRRKLAVVGAGLLSVAALMGLTVLGKRQLDESIRLQAGVWNKLADKDRIALPLLQPILSTARPTTSPATTRPSPLWALSRAPELADPVLQRPIRVPPLFGWLWRSQDINSDRQRALQVAFSNRVLTSVLGAAREKLRFDTKHPQSWSDAATSALAQLIRLEVIASRRAPDAPLLPIQLDPLVRYALLADHLPEFQKDQESLQTNFDWLLTGQGTAFLAAHRDTAAPSVLSAAVEGFNAYWSHHAVGADPTILALRELASALHRYGQREAELCDLAQRSAPATVAQYQALLQDWTNKCIELRRASQAVQAAAAKLDNPGGSLVALYDAQIPLIARKAEDARAALLANIPKPAPSSLERARLALEAPLDKAIEASAADAQRQALPALEAAYAGKPARHALRLKILEDALALIPEQRSSGSPAQLAQALKALDEAEKQALAKVKTDLADLPSESDRLLLAVQSLVKHSARNQRFVLLKNALDQAPKTKQAFAQAVQAALGDNKLSPPIIPLTSYAQGGQFLDLYQPAAAVAVLSIYQPIGQHLKSNSALEQPQLDKAYATVQEQANEYISDYFDYWARQVAGPQALKINAAAWADFYPDGVKIKPLKVTDVQRNLETLAARIEEALTRIRPFAAASDQLRLDAAIKAIRAAQSAAGERKLDIANVIPFWQDLPEKPDAARTKLVADAAGGARKFVENYLLGGQPDQGFIVQYWHDLTNAQLQVLAAAAQAEANAAATTLVQRYRKFPLARAAAESLKPADIVAAKTLAARINLSAQLPEILKDIAKFNQAFADKLALVNGLNIEAHPQGPWILKARTVLEAFPNVDLAGNLPNCSFTLSTVRRADQIKLQGSALNIAPPQWNFVEVARNGQVSINSHKDLAPDDAVAQIATLSLLDAGTVQLGFRRVPQQRADRVFPPRPIDGQWSGLRLLLASAAAPKPVSPENGKSAWLIRAAFLDEDGKTERWTWLRLEFDLDFSKVKEWPE